MKKRIVLVIIIFILITPQSAKFTSASSSGDDDSPPPSSGGGGGGGSPQFFDYYIPLIFNSSNPQGSSEVVLWIYQPTALITTFAQNDFGSSVSQILEPQKVVFNPDEHFGLTNGSLIRSTSPILVTVQRQTQDISTDDSFGYSILPRRMMGFEYYAPFDGYLSVISLNAATEVRYTAPDDELSRYTIDLPLDPLIIPVEKGSYINSSFPIVGAFYSNEEGTSASMAVPKYLQGDKYYIDSNSTLPREDEIDRSYISINPRNPTMITLGYKDGSSTSFDIFKMTTISLDRNIVSIESSRGHIEVNIRIKFDYGGISRVSTIQLMAIDEMRSGESFMIPDDYTSTFSVANEMTKVNVTSYNPSTRSFEKEARNDFYYDELETLEYNGVADSHVLNGDNHLFSYITSPGKISHPMAKSVSFLNLPLNTVTSQDREGLNATWYRIPNLAVSEVKIIPGPLEEYTGQVIFVSIKANGTMPASAFNLRITIDEEVVVEERFDFLQVGETIDFELRKFIDINKKKMSISVEVDTDNEVSEYSEDDNDMTNEFDVIRNIRLWFSFYAIITIIVIYAGYRVRTYLRKRRTLNRAHVDAIISVEESE